MPLLKSSKKSAVGKNIKKEMEAGKPQKQAIAIALATQREARKHGKAMGGEAHMYAEGGAAKKDPWPNNKEWQSKFRSSMEKPTSASTDVSPQLAKPSTWFAHGGEVKKSMAQMIRERNKVSDPEVTEKENFVDADEKEEKKKSLVEKMMLSKKHKK